MDSLIIENIEIKPCPGTLGRYDVFEIRSGEKIKESYSKDLAYGVTLERAISLAVERVSFDTTSDLSSLLNKYHLLKDEFLSKLSELGKKIN